MDVPELLRDLRVDFLYEGHHHCRPGWVQLRHCPFCGSDKYHLGYNLSARFFTCWRCRWHHVIPTLLKLGASYEQAVAAFGKKAASDRPLVAARANKLQEPPGIGPLQKAHQRYLCERGFDPNEIADIWQVKGIGLEGGFLRWRLYIPIFFQGRQVSWTTRAIGDKVSQRYISASAKQETQNHKTLVYGLDLVGSSVVIVEGPTDAWAIGPGAGALFGTAFLPAQVRLLATIPYRYVCFDNAPPAQRQALELCNQLACFPGITHNIVLDAKDPGSASLREIEQVRRFAKLKDSI